MGEGACDQRIETVVDDGADPQPRVKTTCERLLRTSMPVAKASDKTRPDNVLREQLLHICQTGNLKFFWSPEDNLEEEKKYSTAR